MPSTLVKPPPVDATKSDMENVLELTPLAIIAPDLFTNTRPLWHPPGARGIYGGSVIAQSLSAAQATVRPDFTIHSMHCYFVLAGDAEIPVLYHVERVREGRSFATRTVQARQRGKAIFTTTMSFVRIGAGGKESVEHSAQMPKLEEMLGGMKLEDVMALEAVKTLEDGGPFESVRLDMTETDSPHPSSKRARFLIRARGTIHDNADPLLTHRSHCSALAYISDSYFIGTVPRAHGLIRLSTPSIKSVAASHPPKQSSAIKEWTVVEEAENAAAIQAGGELAKDRREVGMMVSLDHTIYFHNPRRFRADEWLVAEMETPWAGDGRGLVLQKMWTTDGVLVASCVQEGVVRLKEKSPESKL